MPKIKVDISKYLIFIYKPSNSYVVIERDFDAIFAKLAIIYDYKFENISDSHLTQVQFLEYDIKTNSHCVKNESQKHVRVNELRNLPAKTKFSIRIQHLFGL